MKPKAIARNKSQGQRFREIWTKYFIANLDLTILIVAAVFFAVGSLLGLDDKVLNPVTVALLGALAFSQIKSRTQISNVAASWHPARTDLFLWDFPEEYKRAQSQAMKSYFFAGVTMGRTLPLMTPHIQRILDQGGLVQILLPDPNNPHLVEMISATRPPKKPAQIKREIQHSLKSLEDIHSSAGTLELRVISFLPSVGINAIDLESPVESHKSLMIQLYEFAPEQGHERAPIFFLTTHDSLWFSHFAAQSKRLWESGTEYRPIP